MSEQLTFYYGAASGQSRSALRQLNEPNVMLNYATSNNEPWSGINRLFIDSGGYSFIKGKGDYQTSPQQYVEYIKRVRPERFALRDYPCERDVLDKHDRTVADHQRMTTEAHKKLLGVIEQRDVRAEWYPVVQGYEISEYLEHLDELRSEGLIDNRLAIGSICGRETVEEIEDIITAINAKVPDVKLHGFGVKQPALLQNDTVISKLDSADSQAYNIRGMYESRNDSRPFTWQEAAFQYLKFKRRIQSVNRTIGDANGLPDAGSKHETLDSF